MSPLHLAISEPGLDDRALAEAGRRLWDALGPRALFLVRERALGARVLLARVRALTANVPAAQVLVSDRVDVARALGVGVQLPEGGLTVAEARAVLGPTALVGASRHTADDAAAAAREGAAIVTIAPVFPTPSKPGHPGLGLEGLAAVVAAVRATGAPTRVIALGGLDAARARAALEAGADGVAGIRAGWTGELGGQKSGGGAGDLVLPLRAASPT